MQSRSNTNLNRIFNILHERPYADLCWFVQETRFPYDVILSDAVSTSKLVYSDRI